MRVVATKDFRTYHRMVGVRVSKGQEFDGEFAEFLQAGNCPVDVIDEESGTPAGGQDGSAGDVTKVGGGSGEPPPPGPGGDGGGSGGPEPDGLDISGTAQQVLDWVGDDPDRARAAHEAESGKDKPRVTLLKRLEEIAGG